MEKDDFCHWPLHLLTEKVIRYLFASAEEVPHVLSLSSSTSGHHVRTEGHLFTSVTTATTYSTIDTFVLLSKQPIICKRALLMSVFVVVHHGVRRAMSIPLWYRE